jgi:hypothetical protein
MLTISFISLQKVLLALVRSEKSYTLCYDAAGRGLSK